MKKRTLPTLGALCLCVLFALPAHAGPKYKAKRETALGASGVTAVLVRTQAGLLTVRGEEGIAEVRASGTAHAPTRDMLDAVVLKSFRDGDRLTVEVTSPEWAPPAKGHEHKGKPMAEEPPVYLDLALTVPAGLPLEVESLWGAMEVRRVGELAIRAERSDITAADVSGDLMIVCGEGEIRAQNVSGDAEVRIRNGDIRIDGVRGSLTIAGHPAGELTIENVGGDVLVPAHGRGDMAVRNVGGDLIVKGDEGGDIRYKNIAGRVTRPEPGPPRAVRERKKRERERREKAAGNAQP